MHQRTTIESGKVETRRRGKSIERSIPTAIHKTTSRLPRRTIWFVSHRIYLDIVAFTAFYRIEQHVTLIVSLGC